MGARKEDLAYRPCAGIFLLNAEGLVFVGERVKGEADTWQLPQGGIDPGETPREAALRELEEEVGTDKVEVIGETSGWLYYEVPAEVRPKSWRDKYQGQKQKWFAMRFLGRDSDINLMTEHPEFLNWKWVARSALPDLAVSFKRELYREILTAFERAGI